jgi:hypothetical protein
MNNKNYCRLCRKEIKPKDMVTDDPDDPCLSCEQTKNDLIYDSELDRREFNYVRK